MKAHKKNPSWKAGGMATMLLSALLFSCNNEDFPDGGSPKTASDNICFGINYDGDTQTRGNAGGSGEGLTTGRFVLRSADSDDTLCVRAIVSDGIRTSASDDRRTVTRGTPIGNTNFYDKFHVVAYWTKDGTLVERFYMDEDAANDGNGTWSTARTYYWPGAEHSFQFYAWAPTDAMGIKVPDAPTSKTLTYTVLSGAADQKDIVVATPGNSTTGEGSSSYPGNYNSAVPLTFKHICTAVRFVVGSEMQPGSINSVALKGIKNAGTYDMTTGAWTLDGTTADFSQTLDKATDGTETDGTEITSGEGTFMLLPQTLSSDAAVEVSFTNANGENRILTASIANGEWPMGNTVTYKLSITPEYELEFVSEPQVQDAHYVIYPITIKADDKLPAGGWTLTSNDAENVTFVEKFESDNLKALIDAGYWIDDYKGTSTLTSTTTGEVKVYVFIKENATEEDREITLSLKPTAQGNYETKEFTFKQYCPAWNNGIGVERIEDGDYPWGFNWDSSMKIVYSMPSGFWAGIFHILFEWFGDHSYIKSEGSAWAGSWKVTVDFSKVPSLKTATSASDGTLNTWQLINFEGISEAETIMNQLESWGGTPDRTLPTNPTEFAARACAMKNKYGVEKQTNQSETVYNPVLKEADMVWYLPAQEEAASMNDNLSGNYWTSTAITSPGTTAYKYTVGGSISGEDRNSVLHVRAVRKKQ